MTEPKVSPPHVQLLLDYVNTLDVELSTDDVATAEALTRWLVERGLAPRGLDADDSDLLLAHQLRSALRAELIAHHGSADLDGAATATSVGNGTGTAFDDLAAQLPLRLTLDAAGARLVPAVTGVAAALATVLAAVASASADGTWPRLKICPAQDCAVGFFDASKNQSRTWCSMRVCGNRQKTKAYRARQLDR